MNESFNSVQSAFSGRKAETRKLFNQLKNQTQANRFSSLRKESNQKLLEEIEQTTTSQFNQQLSAFNKRF